MNYAVIKKNDIANGPGVRVSLFCERLPPSLPELFQPGSLGFLLRQPVYRKTEEEILSALDHSY